MVRYPIDEKTKKPYGIPKGEKAQDEDQIDLDKVNKQKLAAASLDIETRNRAFGPGSVETKAEPKVVEKKKAKKKSK